MKNKILLFIVTTVALLFIPSLNFGQVSPNLGSAYNYVFFSTTGAVTNAGISRVTGNIGANFGAISGWGSFTGHIDSVNSTTAQASLDLQSAYDQLNNAVATDFPGVILGSGQVLFAGVHRTAAATSLNLGLTLDGQGNPNSEFIIQIQGAFSTAANAKVYLINGAMACNVFWKVEGAVSMATGTTMRGTVIAHNAAISMGTGDTLEGRALSTTGAVDAYNAVAYVSCGFYAILRTELLSFAAVCDNKNVLLKWNTTSETNNNSFTVERSAEGIDWQVVGEVAGGGSSSLLHSYSFTDNQSGAANSYYRLKLNEFNEYKYGDVVLVRKCGSDAAESLNLYPNPSRGKFNLLFKGDKGQVHTTVIFNSYGQKVYEATGLESKFDLSDKPPGVYILFIHQNSKTINRKIVLKYD